jgi:hypothetical protein
VVALEQLHLQQPQRLVELQLLLKLLQRIHRRHDIYPTNKLLSMRHLL